MTCSGRMMVVTAWGEEHCHWLFSRSGEMKPELFSAGANNHHVHRRMSKFSLVGTGGKFNQALAMWAMDPITTSWLFGRGGILGEA